MCLMVPGVLASIIVVYLSLFTSTHPGTQFAFGNLQIEAQSWVAVLWLVGLILGAIGVMAVVITRYIEGAAAAQRIPSTLTRLQILLINLNLLFIIAVSAVLVAYWYVAQENDIYFYDYSQYQDRVAFISDVMQDLGSNPILNSLRLLRNVWNSTGTDYSYYHALLPSFMVMALGNSRVVYILSSVFFYLLPYILVVGGLAVMLIRGRPILVFWSAAFITLFISASWIPTLRGYPDNGAAALIGLAIIIYSRDRTLRRSWQILSIGVCLALAILFRRHFLYGAIAVIFAVGLQTILDSIADFQRKSPDAMRKLLSVGVRIGLVVSSLLVFTTILGWPFLERVLSTNFSQLYISYERTPAQNLGFFASHYGFIAIVASIVAFVAGPRMNILVRSTTLTIVIFESYSIIQWLLQVRQLGFHYTLHFTLGIVLGLVALIWIVWSKLHAWRRGAVLLGIGAFIGFNFWVGLAPTNILDTNRSYSKRYDLIEIPAPTHNSPGRELFARNNPPLQRDDYQAMAELVEYLLRTTSPDEQIYVAASSVLLSDNHLWHTLRILQRNDHFNLAGGIFVAGASIDSTTSIPITGLIRAEYVVVANPMQYHLAETEHDLLRVVLEMFHQNWPFTQDFVKLPVLFQLEDQVVVEVYQRINDTSPSVALKTLRDMQAFVGETSGDQPLWADLNASNVDITASLDTSYSFSSNLESDLYFAYLNEVENPIEISGRWLVTDPACGSLSLMLVDAQRIDNPLETVQLDADEPDFNIALTRPDKMANLIVRVSRNADQDDISNCSFAVENLTVEGA
jgi:hypothetical protein